MKELIWFGWIWLRIDFQRWNNQKTNKNQMKNNWNNNPTISIVLYWSCLKSDLWFWFVFFWLIDWCSFEFWSIFFQTKTKTKVIDERWLRWSKQSKEIGIWEEEAIESLFNLIWLFEWTNVWFRFKSVWVEKSVNQPTN